MINEKKLFDLFRDRKGIRPRFEHPHKGAGHRERCVVFN